MGRSPKLVVLVIACICAVTSAAQEASTDGSRKVLQRVEPTYPILARRNNLSGTVKLEIVVSREGKPKEVTVKGGSPVFVQSATDAVKGWKWAEGSEESKVVVLVNFEQGH